MERGRDEEEWGGIERGWEGVGRSGEGVGRKKDIGNRDQIYNSICIGILMLFQQIVNDIHEYIFPV